MIDRPPARLRLRRATPADLASVRRLLADMGYAHPDDLIASLLQSVGDRPSDHNCTSAVSSSASIRWSWLLRRVGRGLAGDCCGGPAPTLAHTGRSG
jgi:hypothetical protein